MAQAHQDDRRAAYRALARATCEAASATATPHCMGFCLKSKLKERYAGRRMVGDGGGVLLPAIRGQVGLKDMRIHDLRRIAASWLVINGSNLPVIQSKLNHTSLHVDTSLCTPVICAGPAGLG